MTITSTTSSQYPQITEALLSAYIDGAVTPAESQLVEEAVANDPNIAWQLETLQYTVGLLGRALSNIELPASFSVAAITGKAGDNRGTGAIAANPIVTEHIVKRDTAIIGKKPHTMKTKPLRRKSLIQTSSEGGKSVAYWPRRYGIRFNKYLLRRLTCTN